MRTLNLLVLFVTNFFIHLIVAETASLSLPEYSCPHDTFVGECTTIPSNTPILLSTSSEVGELLTLTKITNGEVLVPVGRSYDGYDWETVAGPYDRIIYNCTVKQKFCQVIVPSTKDDSNETFFILSRFVHKLKVDEKIARFLEKSTFGTTLTELKELMGLASQGHLNNLYETLIEWTFLQMNQVKPTFHREFFRAHLAATFRDRKPVREGEMIHPCHIGARWRRLAFSIHDVSKDIFISKTNSGRFALSINGHVRTIVDSILFQDDIEFQYTQPENYQLCSHRQLARQNEMIKLQYGLDCLKLKYGNPHVDLDGIDLPPHYIFEDIDPNNFATTMYQGDNNETVSQMLSITSNLLDENEELCSSISSDDDTPVFIRLKSGQVLVSEQTLGLKNNDIGEPLHDGGASAFMKNSQCANAPRTFVNDNYCKLSNSTYVCSPSGNLNGPSIELNEENLLQIYKITGRLVYAVQGLRISDIDYYDYLEFPCSEGARSRWVQLPNKDDCIKNKNVSNKTSGTCFYFYVYVHLASILLFVSFLIQIIMNLF